jgi:HD-GYP domain-containing protein (c-di-GMP phosphodiesterase class II)
VILACDAYDAMTSDRVYRKAMTTRAAMTELRRCAGTDFDPQVVDVLAAVIAATA